MPSDVPADAGPSAGPSGAARLVVLEPATGWVPLRLGDLWEYRELLYFLTWRDIKVRYKQTALGAAWAVIQPFF
ncbi:MAG: ABC transporter permease, partial [Gemmatimonadetes bacterium]|nr:ABC transporter permease [Gemmatimonadota bacterium]